MSAYIKIDQGALPAGVAGKSRTDGTDDGEQVVLTNTRESPGTTRFRFLWVPPGDTTSVDSLADTEGGPHVWAFEPTPEIYGTWRIELIGNEGLATEYRERRTFSVRTPERGLLIPALNEVADPSVNLENANDAAIQASENNADDFAAAPLNERRYAGWWRALHELTLAVDGVAQAATGSDNGFLARYIYTPANDGMVWSTAADIPPGNWFQIMATGAGGGGRSGAAQALSQASTAGQGGPGGGGGARPPPVIVSRAYLVAQLPITFTLPVGGSGGAARSGVGINLAGLAGTAPTGPTLMTGANGIIARAFQGAQSASATQGGPGGGLMGAPSGTSGGKPTDVDTSTSGIDYRVFGGQTFQGRTSSDGSGTRTIAVYGGAGGGISSNNGSNAAAVGGESEFGGGGGGGGRGGNAGTSAATGAGNYGGGHDVTLINGGSATTGGTPGSNPGGSGGNGAAGDDIRAGRGGGSGASAIGNNAVAGSGGHGGHPGGGGGGGGGAASNSAGHMVTSGAGGNGGDSEIRILAFGG